MQTPPQKFTLQSSWEWDESDLECYRYATEKWKCHSFENWGVLELPAGKDAANNFFSILRLHQEDERGSLARGGRTGGELDPATPLLLLFRLRDGYYDAFAAVQFWPLFGKLIDQDRSLYEAGKFPGLLSRALSRALALAHCTAKHSDQPQQMGFSELFA